MKRPSACIGLSMLFSLVFAVEFYSLVPYVASALFILSVTFYILKYIAKKKTIAPAVCCLSACIAMFSYCIVVEKYVNPLIDEYDGQIVEFSATVTSKPYTSGSNTYFTVKTDLINSEEKSINIQIITGYPLSMDIYDTIKGTAEFYSDYESGYGYASYYGARNIFLKAYINPYYDSSYEVVHNDDRPFYAVFSDLRDTIYNTFKTYLPYDEASLCTAVITGEKNYLRDEIYTSFQNLGVSHLLVVSGLHLSIVFSFIYAITTKLTKKKLRGAVLQTIGVFAFAALSGFGFSVIRALVMVIVIILARMTSSNPDTLNSLGLAAIILCLNPLNVGDIGMLWSFSCTISLTLFSKPFYNDLTKKLEMFKNISPKIISLASTAMAAFIGSLPFLIFVTGSLSPYTIIVNILTVPFTGLIIVCGGLSVLFFSLHISIIAYPLIYISGVTAKYLIFVINTFSKLPMSMISVNKQYISVWFIISVSIIALFYFTNKKRYIKLSALAMTAILILLFSFDIIFNTDKITLSVLDVGNGITVTVKNEDKIVLLNSYGEKYQYTTIKNELEKYNDISCIIDIPPYKTDYDYCSKIIKDYSVSDVFVYDDQMYEEDYCYLRSKGMSVTNIDENYTLYLFENTELNIITSGESTWEYLSACDTDILICPPKANFSCVPMEFANPDIIIINDIPENFDISDDTYVVVSNYAEECDSVVSYLNENGIPAGATNGLGRIDIELSDNGSVVLSREFTGGVTRYDDN